MPNTVAARMRGHLSLVISCLALVVAMSGTAFAVGIAPGSIDTKELAKGAVTAKKIKAKAVTARKIRPSAVGSVALADGSVGSADLADGTVGSADLADGSVGAADLADNSVGASELLAGAVGTSVIADGSVGAADLADSSVGTSEIADRSIRLRDLGGEQAPNVGNPFHRVTTLNSPVSILAGDCANLSLTTMNPAPAGIFGSMVVGTVTNSAGGAVVNNLGAILPTLATETSQGGVVLHLTICAGASGQTIPAGSIVTWSLIAP
jgi:hypothetical protein